MVFDEKRKNMAYQLQEMEILLKSLRQMCEDFSIYLFSQAITVSDFGADKPAQSLLTDSGARLAARTDVAEHADIIAGCQREGKAAHRNVLYWMAHVIARSFQERGRGENQASESSAGGKMSVRAGVRVSPVCHQVWPFPPQPL